MPDMHDASVISLTIQGATTSGGAVVDPPLQIVPTGAPSGNQSAAQLGKFYVDTTGRLRASTGSSSTFSTIPDSTNGFVPVSAGFVWHPVGLTPPTSSTFGTDSACTNGDVYVGPVFVPDNETLTGVSYLVGSVGGTDKVIAYLLDRTCTSILAQSAAAGATVGTLATMQDVAFTSTYAVKGPGLYFIGLQFNGTTAKFRTHTWGRFVASSTAGTFAALPAITAPTTFTANKAPVAVLY